MSQKTYEPVDASPVKRFFVEMLTRDIELEDAILDLLDNCIDGILRGNTTVETPDKPYDGFWAKITINKHFFEIEDNCGGIPWSLHDKAFRMGRPQNTDSLPNDIVDNGVGVYGIGMKRAIFKMGSDALVWTQNGDDAYEVPISKEWMNDQENWHLDVKTEKGLMSQDGTCIMVEDLHEDVSERFSAEKFVHELVRKIAKHYAVIISKGFSVKVNDIEAMPRSMEFRFARESNGASIQPYIFRSSIDGVEVFLTIGLREPIPDAEKLLDEQEQVKYSSDDAGWTIICNDRVVLYCDRSELTGWGLFGIPRYHTQFSAISGIVEFRGDPQKLPTTTTKRGLNFSSTTYQRVLGRMQEGLRLFVDFTNKWKSLEPEARKIVSAVPTLSYPQLRVEAERLTFNQTRRGIDGEQFKPNLPTPPNDSPDVRISYIQKKSLVKQLAEELLSDMEDIREKDIPRMVGKASFDFTYEQFVKKASE